RRDRADRAAALARPPVDDPDRAWRLGRPRRETHPGGAPRDPGRRSRQPRLRGPEEPRPTTEPLDELLPAWPEPAALARDLPAVGGVDQGRRGVPGDPSPRPRR